MKRGLGVHTGPFRGIQSKGMRVRLIHGVQIKGLVSIARMIPRIHRLLLRNPLEIMRLGYTALPLANIHKIQANGKRLVYLDVELYISIFLHYVIYLVTTF